MVRAVVVMRIDPNSHAARLRSYQARSGVHLMSKWIDSRYMVFLAMAACMACVADLAYAQDLQPVNDIAEYVQGFLTGRLATSLAVIAVAVVGYLFWAGQIASQAALAVVAGIALVFGSAQIVAILEAVAR
jgi:type IV secretory pathway VirB2 component (pilin)